MIKLATARALQIIREHRIVQAGQFARFMWPDRHAQAMPKAGGSFIGKLRKRQLVEGICSQQSPVRLTETGRRELEEFELMQRISDV